METSKEDEESLIEKHLKVIETLERSFLDLGHRSFTADDGNIRTADLALFIGATKRTLAHCSGFRSMISSRNFICAAAILRMQLDTSLRLYGATLVDDLDHFARGVLNGDKISNYRDRDNKRMYDGYLVDRLSERYPWVKPVYNNTSGFIHLSSRHLWMALHHTEEEEDRTVYIQVSSEDVPRPDKDYTEILQAFIQATRLIYTILGAYTLQKEQHQS